MPISRSVHGRRFTVILFISGQTAFFLGRAKMFFSTTSSSRGRKIGVIALLLVVVVGRG
jgi:hypothetical protein